MRDTSGATMILYVALFTVLLAVYIVLIPYEESQIGRFNLWFYGHTAMKTVKMDLTKLCTHSRFYWSSRYSWKSFQNGVWYYIMAMRYGIKL